MSERRVSIEKGRPMPSAFATVPKRGVVSFFAGQESKEVETGWTLVAYEKDGS